jgi:GAF domain-containing protein
VPVEVQVQDVVSHGTPTRVLRIRDISERVRHQADKEQLLRQLAEMSEELSGLKQVSSISVNVAQPDLAMDSMVRQMAMIAGADSGMVMERNGDRLTPRSVHGMGDRLPPGYTEDIGSLFPGKLVTTNQDLYIEDVQVEPEVSEVLKATGARTLMGVPIRNGGNIIGVLFLRWSSPHPRIDRERELMEIVADRCASVIMSSNVNEQTRANEDLNSMLNEINSELSTTLKLGMSKFQ